MPSEDEVKGKEESKDENKSVEEEEDDEDKTDYGEQETFGQVFFNNIHAEEVNLSLFTDELTTYNKKENVVGSYKAVVERIRRNGDDLIKITVDNKAQHDARTSMGNSLVCYLDGETLLLVEQEHKQWVKSRDYRDMRKLTTLTYDKETREMRCVRETQEGDELKVARWRHVINRQTPASLVMCEGAAVLMQRLMIRFHIRQDVAFRRLDPETGKLTRVLFKPISKRQQTINYEDAEVMGIERLVAASSPDDVPTMWQSYFLPDGHLTLLVQVGSAVCSQAELMPNMVVRDRPDPPPTFAKKRLLVDDDVEMMSRFVDRGEELRSDHMTYLRSHPEARDLLADFFQHVLIERPDDIVQSAANFFAPFAAHVGEDMTEVTRTGELEAKLSSISNTSDSQPSSYPLAARD